MLSPSLEHPICILGKRGMLGHDLVDVFKTHYDPSWIHALGREDLDLTDENRVLEFVDKIQPSILINATGYTNVDQAERERELAYLINTEVLKYLRRALRGSETYFVHFSTDQVFDGKSDEVLGEQCPVGPQNHYAFTKFLGEQIALEYRQALVLRVQWLYGQKKDRFTLLKDMPHFSPFTDQWGAPTWTRHIAETLIELIEKQCTGLYHLAYDDHASWYEVYSFVAQTMNYPTQLVAKKTHEVELAAKRPLNVRLSNDKLLGALGREFFGSWKSALKMFLYQYGKN